MKATIIIVFKLCFLLSLANTLHAQETEVKALNNAFILFGNYQNGKIDSLPRNEANYHKVAAHLDKAFKTFILHKKSQDYEKFVLAYGSTNFKFFRLERGTEIGAVSFLVDSVAYVVFSYNTMDRDNYFIKRLADNTIVFDGNAKASFIAGMYTIEKNRILLVEDYYKSRRASVIATEGKAWKQVEAFKGLAFGQVADNYMKRKFVDKRVYFKLECEMEVLITASSDANEVTYNERTKTLSYKQYDNNRRFKKIEAKYENGMFVIDDYNAGDGISSNSPSVPR